MSRALGVCIFLFISTQLCAQEKTPALQHIEIVEGDGAINSIRMNRAHNPVVRVTDAAGEPMKGVTVTFTLPLTGASATFPDGGVTSTIQTDQQGIAQAHGLRPNSIAGEFQIHVTASSHGSLAQATLTQTNAEPVARSSHTKLFVILVAVAGAAAGGAVLAAHGKSGTPDTTITTTSSTGSISAGTPIFGPPH